MCAANSYSRLKRRTKAFGGECPMSKKMLKLKNDLK